MKWVIVFAVFLLAVASPAKALWVNRGDWVGNEGSTGYSTGPHLHWEVIVSSTGERVNPRDYIPDPFIWPMEGFIVTQEFGWTDFALAGGYGGNPHNGIDLSAPYGASVHAASGGEVILSSWYRGYGNCVIIDHENGLWTLYGHMSSAIAIPEPSSILALAIGFTTLATLKGRKKR